MSSAREVVESYFSCMRAGDRSVADLFHDDARLVGLGTVVRGRPAIDEFYAQSIDQGRPQPRLIGALLIEGDRVGAELVIELADDSSLHVLDLFEIERGRIRSLTYFVADHP